LKLPFKNKKLPVLFLSNKSKYNTKHKVDILLSPEFYWSRVFKIPTKYSYEAKKYLPSLFGDIVPRGVNYRYKISKIDKDTFVCIAYSLERVIKGIEDSGLANSNVNKIFFSQFEINYKTSVKINEKYSLEKIDNIVLRVPNKYIEESIDIQNVLENINPSGASISVGYYSNILDTKSYGFIFAILTVIFLANSFDFAKKYVDLKSAKDEIVNIKKKYKLPPTILQTKAKLNKLSKIDREQKAIRDSMFYIFNYDKEDTKKESFADFYINKKLVRMELKGIPKERIQKYLEKKFKDINIYENGTIIKVDLKL
jgi:hypothetical protein